MPLEGELWLPLALSLAQENWRQQPIVNLGPREDECRGEHWKILP